MLFKNKISGAIPDSGLLLAFKEVLERGFREDLGFGDITGNAVLPGHSMAGEFSARASGVLAGADAIRTGYQLLDSSTEVQQLKQDGENVQPGDVIAEVKGPVRTLLSGERLILNIVQHLSGIATATSKAVRALEGSSTRICDTRKTIPGIRALQKYAVRCGGGYNHRLRLDDGVMIKDNHIIAAGGIREAIGIARKRIGLMVRIEVECETGDQVRDAIEAGADIIMLDNKTPEEAGKLCSAIPPHIIVELSGGITPETAGRYRDCGAHYLSLGAVTHSVRALDISFNLREGVKHSGK
ncbi:MAG: carboxylating nicotinate-nucleotide diphosphorylase [Balneolaceae bacterium]